MISPTAAAGRGDSARRTLQTDKDVVAAADLPQQLGDLVLGVTRRCRLWTTERRDVARELCAHFADGLESGTTVAELAAAFGDTRHTATLIRVTKKRLRPLWWRTSRGAVRGLAALLLVCLLVYAVLAARFFLISPRMSRNFIAELNEPVLRTAGADRAWPLYIEARRRFGPLPDFMLNSSQPDPRRPGDLEWDRMVRWLDEHQEALDLVRGAAGRPTMGYLLRAGMDPDLGRAIEATAPGYKFDPALEPNSDIPMVMGLLLPHLGEVRKFARWLHADAELAASRGDAAAFLRDIDAILGMARQMTEEPMLICGVVGVMIADVAVAAVLSSQEYPAFLSDSQLRDLAHTVAGFARGRVEIDASAELIGVEDLLQRFFSDDGHGDGHFVGGPALDHVYQDLGVARNRYRGFMRVVQPVQSAMIESRTEIRTRAERFVAQAALDNALPPWRHDERCSDRLFEETMASGLYMILPSLAQLRDPKDQGPVANACAGRDIFEARRQAAAAVLGIESFRRSRGGWPQRLQDLVPVYLPVLPVDPFDGRPLRYLAATSSSERPKLYSVGVDGVDNGGRAPDTEAGRFGVHDLHWLAAYRTHPTLTTAEQQRMDSAAGDWVLWPLLPPVARTRLPDTNSENVHIN